MDLGLIVAVAVVLWAIWWTGRDIKQGAGRPPKMGTGGTVTRNARGHFQSWEAAQFDEVKRRLEQENYDLVSDAIEHLGLDGYRAWAATQSRETLLGSFSFNRALKTLLGKKGE